MPLAQDRLLDLMASSPVRYHRATDALYGTYGDEVKTIKLMADLLAGISYIGPCSWRWLPGPSSGSLPHPHHMAAKVQGHI